MTKQTIFLLSISVAITSNLLAQNISGDISIRSESRDFDKEIGTYYQNTAYVVPSIGLNYQSETKDGLSASAGVRFYNIAWEDDSYSTTSGGEGDARERFKESSGNDNISHAYVEYQKDNLNLKIGRKNIPWGSIDWITKIHDGVFISYKEKDFVLEALYSQRRGKVYAKESSPFEKVNNGHNLYQSAINYTINENYKTKAYIVEAPNSHTTYGAKLFTTHPLNSFTLNTMTHIMNTKEDILTNDTNFFQFSFEIKKDNSSLLLGYVQNDKENGFGSADSAGEAIVEFEEGDAMYESNANTYYFMASQAIMQIDFTVIYGQTTYSLNRYKSKELDVLADYDFSKSLALSVNYSITKEDARDSATFSDMQQLGATLKYSF